MRGEAVLGRSLVELSSTLGVRLKNRRPLFTVKKNGLQIKKTCKVMSAGCTTCNIYNRHTQYLQLKTSKTHMVVHIHL